MSKTLDELLPNGKFCAYWFDQDVVNKPPWLDESRATNEAAALRRVTGDEIDALFFMEFGDRPISRFLKGVDPDSESSVKAASLKVLKLCYLSWLRLTEDYVAQYDPVENYSMVEGGDDTIKKQGANATTSGTAQATLTQSTETNPANATLGTLEDYTVTTKPAETTTTEKSAPYDSETFQNQAQVSVALTGGNNKEGSTKEKGKRGAANVYDDTESRRHDFERHGNIGVMTATQMIENDSQFWSANNFFDKIAADVASYITIPIYE